MTQSPFIILASQSPRRKMLLQRHGYRFEVRPSHAEEKDAEPHNVADIVQTNARIKGSDVVQQLESTRQSFETPTVILAADTLVAMGQRVFPKPRDIAQAHEFLETLGGHPHQVLTGVFLHHLQAGTNLTFYDQTEVTLKKLNHAEREALFQRVNPLDKAGAYGSQDAPDILDHLQGHLSTVIGLPMEVLAEQLDKLMRTCA